MTAQPDNDDDRAARWMRPSVWMAPPQLLDELDAAARAAAMPRSAFVRAPITDKLREASMDRDAACAAVEYTLRDLPPQSADQRKRLERAALIAVELTRVAARHRSGDL